jgi:hypothetical protein
MGSLETAYLRITTPKGTTLSFDKWPPAKLKNKWTENNTVYDLIWKIYNASSVGWIELTKDEVLLLKEYSNLQNVDLINHKTFPQRKREMIRQTPRGNLRAGKCSCGNDLITKDHKTWVGWYCPKCGQGGSYNK